MICFAGSSFAQTQLVSDNFTGGSNGAYLGSNWTGCGFNNGAYNVLVYENGAAGGSGYWAQDCALYTGYGAFPSDQYVGATIVAPNPNSSPQASIQLRANAVPSTSEYYVACGWDSQDFPADPHYRIWSLAPGASGPVSLWLSNIIPATNDVISCQILGNTLSMNLNGSVVSTVVDTSGNNTGYPGMYYVDPNGTGSSPTDIIFANFVAGSGPALISVVITPPTATVTAGSFIQFTGVATYADGSTSGMNNWSSTAPTVAQVDNTGFVYGVAAGNVTITGASASDSGTANLSVQAPNGYMPLVHDAFTGTGGGYLGSNWTGCGYSGGAYSQLVYQNNQAGGSGYYSQNCSAYTGYGAFPGDQYATAMIVAPNTQGTTEAAVQLRANATPGTPESYIACGWDAQDFPADYHYRIWSLPPNPASGGPTNLVLTNVVPATNDLLWCQVQGTSVTMKVNGTTIATATDTSGVMTGYPALYYIDLNGGVPPATDVIFDNFVAGQITGPTLNSITITPNPASTMVGTNVQFAATGSYSDGSNSNITNSVTWSSSNLSIATVNASGLATALGSGATTIGATSGTVSAGVPFTVNAVIAPTVAFTGAPASAGKNSTFTVIATTNASVMPTFTGSAGICSVGSVNGTPASANASVTMLSGTGTCTLTATWAATANYSTATLTQTTTAQGVAPTTSFTGAPSSAAYYGTFTVTATTNASTMPQISGNSVCSAGAVTGTPANASAVITMSKGSGTCTLTATWAADSNYLAANATQNTNATKATSTASITSNTPNPSSPQQAVMINFTAAGIGAGPTGSVKVTASTKESCTATLNSSHTGSCSITFSNTGNRTLSALYGGDSNFNSSTSSGVSQSVNSPTVSLSPSSINYGNVSRKSSQTKGVTISNTSSVALLNLSWSISGSFFNFSIAGSTCGTAPAKLNPGASCVVNVTFSPWYTGSQSATLSFTDNASNSPQKVALSGSGT